jgi:hypothetical protein
MSAKFLLKILRVMIHHKPLNSLNIQKHHHKLIILYDFKILYSKQPNIGISSINNRDFSNEWIWVCLKMWYALEFMAN